ncbi:site-specific integrase [Nocardia sp. NEAU-G5]|uniref:Site-specific integrase n=1 Tax=Nocardia albiluteola TaxID=2842303 RepID=A0ABS6B1Q6_9NOCA|nr:site-specific integrase [Nocardia albiluteola]
MRWHVRFTPAELPYPRNPLPFVSSLPTGWVDWLRQAELVPGTPFLLSPRWEYDLDLNRFFQSAEMVGAAWNTQVGYARDVAAFLTFLWSARERRSWRDADEADHLAYLFWRRRDVAGPAVAGRTWDREVAAVNKFYRWALRKQLVQVNPIPQVSRRPVPLDAGWAGCRTLDEQRPATYSHDAARERVEWLPPPDYRRWRDVGVRGFTAIGLPDNGFRGRWAARNAIFCDLMVRTGLRLSEQSALTVFDVPLDRTVVGYQRFWLPVAIAKGGSARWVYVPASVVADLDSYRRFDRAEVIDDAQARYRRRSGLLVVEDPAKPVATRILGAGVVRRVKVAGLAPRERRSLMIAAEAGLEPALFWLSEDGWPLSVSRWKQMFVEANVRCARAGLALAAHAHLLRHTFAVVTLEQLQRGHLVALVESTPEQRGHYVRVFGDPLDWVRRRLGHRSVSSTHIYLHALAELEMETRLALVPDSWEDPRSIPAHQLPPDDAADHGDVDGAVRA